MENNKKIVNPILFFLTGLFLIVFTLVIILSKKAKDNNFKQLINPSPTTTSINTSNLNARKFPLTTPHPSAVKLISPIPPPSFTGVKEEPIDPQLIKKSNQTFDLIKKSPLVLENLKISYDFKSENFVVSPQSGTILFNQEEREKIYQWFEKNYPNIPKDKIIFSSTPYVSPTPIPRPSIVSPIYLSPAPTSTSSPENEINESFKILAEILKTISDIASIYNQPLPSITPQNPNNSINSNNLTQVLSPVNYQSPKTQYPFIYYPQCGGPFDNYPLPGGCNICKAGCGPTTVAMIIASYKDKTIDPRYVVNEYGSSVGCDGSSYLTAIQVLSNHGISVGQPFFFNYAKAEEVVNIFKGYINVGKTIFALARFCESGCGHFFWIVDVDQNNNIWSFDPYYGRFQIPYNQNSRYPYPLYRLGFAVSP